MKKVLIFSLAVFLMLSCFVLAPQKPVYALESSGEISVIGESHIKLSPDMATVSATINQVDLELDVAKDKTFEIYNSVKSELSASEHISKLNLLYFSTYPNFDYTNGKTLTGYNASLSFEYQVDDILQIQSSIDSLIKCGVKNVSSVNYQVRDYESEYNKLLQSAIENATEKAKLILGTENIKIKNIVEQETYNSCYMYKSYFECDGSNNFDSQIEISAKVKVVFE